MTSNRPFKIGDIIVGEFKIQNIFGGEGKSGMGVVYLVTSRNYPRPFVLKTFQKSEMISLLRFRSEAETWISIGIHPNIVKALFVDEINEQLFIGAEYIPPDENNRNTIYDYLKEGGTSTQNIVKWTAQFCYGMEYAILKGLKSHRDIKPENLMVDELGNLKITDFGLSKFDKSFLMLNKSGLPKENFLNKLRNAFQKPNSNEDNLGLTKTGSLLGTILYAAPEQILDPSKADIRSDIYSFGIVLYQLISLGAYPYSLKGKTTIQQLALMHLKEPLIKIDHPFSSITYKCLSRDPNNRYQSLKSLLLELEKLAEKLKINLPQNRIQEDAHLRELYIQSYSFLTLGEIKKARDLIDSYLEQDQLDSSAWSLKGRIENQLGNLDEAIKTTLKSYQIDPYNSHTCNNLGLFYKKNSEINNAINFLKEAIIIDPYNSGALANLAITYAEKGDYNIAGDLIIKAIHLAPDKKTIHFNAGNIAVLASKEGHVEKAIEIFKLLTKLDNENIFSWFNLGLIYKVINMLQDAKECFLHVEQHSPDDEQTLISLVKINGEMGNYTEAISYCEKLLNKKLSMVNAICWKAQYMQAKGNGVEAIDFIKSVISNNQMNDHLWITLANMYSVDGNYRKAVAMIIRARQILMEKGESNDKEKMDFLSEKQSYFQKMLEHEGS